MKYAVFTVQTPSHNWEQILANLKNAGYDGVEWRVSTPVKQPPDPMPPRERWYWENNRATLDIDNIARDAADAAQLCKTYGVAPISLTSYLTPDQTERATALISAAAAIRCPMVRLNPPVYNGDTNYNTLVENTRAQLAELAPVAQEAGVMINMEIHMGNIIPSANAARRLLEGFDSKVVGVIFDPGNMVHEGYEQYKMGMELLGDYIHLVHVKDARWEVTPQKEGRSLYQVQWCPIGQGVVDFAKLVEAMRAIGYNGWLSFEDFSNEHTDEEKLANNLAYIKRLVEG